MGDVPGRVMTRDGWLSGDSRVDCVIFRKQGKFGWGETMNVDSYGKDRGKATKAMVKNT